MKSINNSTSKINIKFAIILMAMMSVISSCDENEFLKEVPLDFYSPENSYITYQDFESALMNLYDRVRTDFFSSSDGQSFPSLSWTSTEIIFSRNGLSYPMNWGALLLPTNSGIVYDALWVPAYRIIYDANVIIDRTDSRFSQLTEAEKKKIKAEASFFRAFNYRMLAYLYGGVPLVLEELSSPKRDYVRATREEVYQQCITDLKFAAENLPGLESANDARISNLTAYHYLAEVYLAMGRWQDAIDAASVVIDHPQTALMTQRFGSRANEVANPAWPWATGGDVYWDLFQQGNQNRSSGNKEALWVLQYAFQVQGGLDGGPRLERELIPRLWQANINNAKGTATIIPHPNTYYYGRGSGFTRPSHYFFQTVWNKSGYNEDIRNSASNIVRDFIVNNPASDHNGKWIFKDKVPIRLNSFNDTTRNFFPVVAKASVPGKHPAELYLADQTVPGSLTSNARDTYRDQYIVRLADTYLLRAEAYLGKDDKVRAAADINVVRNRSNAPEIQPSSVDIDYILDERIRELHFEELYLLTLARLGKIVERAKLTPVNGNNYLHHNNLWPIPYADIEKNLGAKLEQNPGYN
jgi:starch-binding outer membrane protein, SusD/RagB family